MIEQAISDIKQGRDLTGSMMQAVMEEIMTGAADTEKIVSFLEALSAKGETPGEVTAAAEVMRRHCTKIVTKHKIVLDTCGTGGDCRGTFNVSTAVAFVAAGAGVPVAKHGNRSVSSRCGSADILEALGVLIDMPPEKIARCLDDTGIAFLFAQTLHPAMKYASPARKKIGRRTIFNLLGPLCNPAGATHQLVGVYDRYLADVLGEVLANLGTKRALIVHGEDGLDEITLTADTYVSQVDNGKVSNFKISPREFGFPLAKSGDLSGGDVATNAQIIMAVLEGKTGPWRDIVLLNAAFALYAAEKAASPREGVDLARDSIDSKKALGKLQALKEFSKSSS